jgi:hypothetical protein
MRESSCNFAGVLHNGEHIIGTGRKTTLVPKGRGPFSSWSDAAIDAIKLHGLHKITDWSIERLLYEAERFNGWGYQPRGPSPYVWSGTNWYKAGKYIADGVYSATHIDTQLGVAIIWKQLQQRGIEIDGNPKPTPAPKPTPKPAPIPAPPDIEPTPPTEDKPGWFSTFGRKVRGLIVGGGFLGGLTWLTDWQIAAAFFVFVLILIGIAIAVFFWIWDAEDVRDWFNHHFKKPEA